MADFQRVVEYLRDIRSMQNPPVTDELRQHAQEFADLCVQANDRLRKCSGFLQQGLRSEAIHLAEESPNLLDLITALDLPDPQVWVEFCQATDLPVPPPLQLDRATQLNEAYAIDQPMEHLLARHRLLALQRAQVGKRLSVMRQLAAQDPGSSFWEKDIRQFEKVRLRELPGEFYDALRRHDDTSVVALVEEIEGQPWYEAVPDDLRNSINEANARIQRTALEVELRRQLDALHEAFAARSLDQATTLMARWNETVKAAGAPNISKTIVDQVAPIAAWIEQETQAAARLKSYKNAVATFTQLLDQDASDTELDSALDKVRAFDDQTVPENLLQRLAALRTRRTEVVRAKQKMRLFMLGTAAAVVLLIAAAALFLIMRNQGAAGWVRRINIAVDSRQVKSVEDVLADLKTNGGPYQHDPAVSTAVQKATTFLSARKALNDKLNLAKTHLAEWKTQYQAILDDKSKTPEELFAQADDLDGHLKDLPTDDEIKEADDGSLEAARTDAVSVRSAIRSRASGLVRDQLAALQTLLDKIPAGTHTPEDAGTLSKIETEASRLRDIPGLDEPTKNAASDLVTKVTNTRSAADEADAIKRDLAGLLQHTDSIDGYKEALDSFIAAHPSAPQIADFKTASTQLAALKPLSAWQDQIKLFGGAAGLKPASQAEAQKRLDALTEFLKANPQSPLLPQITAYSDYLKAAADALGDTGTLQKAFGDLTANPIITQLRYLEDTNGSKYFVLDEAPKILHGGVGSRTTVSFEQVDPANPIRKKPVEVDSPIHLLSETPKPVPHMLLAGTIDGIIRRADETNWDTAGFDLIDKIAYSGDDIDPVVKVTLLQAAITAVKQSNGPLIGAVYDKTLQNLGKVFPPNQPMLLLQGKTVKDLPQSVQDQLSAYLKAMPSGKSIADLYLAKRNEMLGILSIEWTNTGMIRKDDSGPVILTRADPGNGAAARASVNGSLTVIARFADGKWTLDPAANTLPEGTLLLIAK